MIAPAPSMAPQLPAGRHQLRRFPWLRTLGAAARTSRGITGLVLTGLVALLAIAGPFLTPFSSVAFVTTPFAPPSHAHLLGADILGRDVLSRVLDGGWLLLVMAVGATAFGIVVGAAAGVSAAYLRGRVDGLIMRTVDVILAFPQIVFALLLLSIVGPRLWLIVLAVGFSHAPAVARVLRAATLEISERDYVKSVELQGVPPTRIMTREIMPNLISPLMVEIGLRLTYSIVILAGLAFLGFGLQPPAPNWGYMINENRAAITTNPWGVLAPAIVIAVLTIGVNTFTDAVARVAIGIDRKPEEAALIDSLVKP
jgi:peptide/nickel transport system permease protein